MFCKKSLVAYQRFVGSLFLIVEFHSHIFFDEFSKSSFFSSLLIDLIKRWNFNGLPSVGKVSPFGRSCLVVIKAG